MAKNRKVLYVTPGKKGGWDVKNEGSSKALKNLDRKTDAVKYGRGQAKSADLGQMKIQKKDGSFQKEYTYGKDPEKYKG
jgi:hypothetical protein